MRAGVMRGKLRPVLSPGKGEFNGGPGISTHGSGGRVQKRLKKRRGTLA